MLIIIFFGWLCFVSLNYAKDFSIIFCFRMNY